jgi:hypothetical protein
MRQGGDEAVRSPAASVKPVLVEKDPLSSPDDDSSIDETIVVTAQSSGRASCRLADPTVAFLWPMPEEEGINQEETASPCLPLPENVLWYRLDVPAKRACQNPRVDFHGGVTDGDWFCKNDL